MSVVISSINHVKVDICDERDFKILESLSNKAKTVEVYFYSWEIQEINEPN
jgi:hypothetical protein